MKKLNEVSVDYVLSVLEYLKENTDCTEDEFLYVYKLSTFFPKLTLGEQHDLFEACKTNDRYIIQSYITTHPNVLFDETGTSIPKATYSNDSILAGLDTMYQIALAQPGREGSSQILKAINFDIPKSKNPSLNSTISKFILTDKISYSIYDISNLSVKSAVNPMYEFALNCILTYCMKNKKKLSIFEYDMFIKNAIYRLDILIDGKNNDNETISLFKSGIEKLYSNR